MSMHPPFLAFLVCMILLISILGSNGVPWWRVAAFLVIGFCGLWASSGAYSILGPGPAVDAAGNMIKDAAGHPLYRSGVVASAEAFMNATVYLSFGCLIVAAILMFMKLCAGEAFYRRSIQGDKISKS